MSAASVWELAIKRSLGKVELPADFRARLGDERIQVLSVTAEQALAVADLPLRHKDPFDRMLVAQCLVEDLILVTADAELLGYPVPVLRA